MNKSGTQPGLLVSELIAGDGPHVEMAESFVLRRCERCGSRTGGELAISQDGWTCSSCLTTALGLVTAGH